MISSCKKHKQNDQGPDALFFFSSRHLQKICFFCFFIFIINYELRNLAWNSFAPYHTTHF